MLILFLSAVCLKFVLHNYKGIFFHILCVMICVCEDFWNNLHTYVINVSLSLSSYFVVMSLVSVWLLLLLEPMSLYFGYSLNAVSIS